MRFTELAGGIALGGDSPRIWCHVDLYVHTHLPRQYPWGRRPLQQRAVRDLLGRDVERLLWPPSTVVRYRVPSQQFRRLTAQAAAPTSVPREHRLGIREPAPAQSTPQLRSDVVGSTRRAPKPKVLRAGNRTRSTTGLHVLRRAKP